jgi:hypothetical protein
MPTMSWMSIVSGPYKPTLLAFGLTASTPQVVEPTSH